MCIPQISYTKYVHIQRMCAMITTRLRQPPSVAVAAAAAAPPPVKVMPTISHCLCVRLMSCHFGARVSQFTRAIFGRKIRVAQSCPMCSCVSMCPHKFLMTSTNICTHLHRNCTQYTIYSSRRKTATLLRRFFRFIRYLRSENASKPVSLSWHSEANTRGSSNRTRCAQMCARFSSFFFV